MLAHICIRSVWSLPSILEIQGGWGSSVSILTGKALYYRKPPPPYDSDRLASMFIDTYNGVPFTRTQTVCCVRVCVCTRVCTLEMGRYTF